MDLWIYKDTLPVYDEVLKQTTCVSIEEIYLLVKSSANDPIVIQKSITENNPDASMLLSSTFVHINNVLGQEACPWDQLFNTDARAPRTSRQTRACWRASLNTATGSDCEM